MNRDKGEQTQNTKYSIKYINLAITSSLENTPKLSDTLEITKLINTYSLVDVWREKNPTTSRYTWLQGISNKQARLDYFLCNSELVGIISEEDILYKYRSDHAPIVLTVSLSDQKRGPGGWKFNNKLLLDKDFIKILKTEISTFKQIHAATPYNPNYVVGMSKNLQYMVKPTTLWETLLCTLRGVIIKYSKQKSRGKRDRTTNLEESIKKLDKEISTGKANITSLKKLRDLNDILIDIKNEELKGSLVRSRAEWLDLGEKPSKFFLNLENRNRVNKIISEIKLDDNTTIKNQMSILEELQKFYKSLYSEKKHQEEPTNIKLNNKKLSEKEKEALESPINKKELDEALKALKNNKAPGPDGFSAEFYKKFWDELGHLFLDYINYCHTKGHLTTTLLEGTITCLPKGGKARNLIKNWRPISLLNTAYKLTSTCITNRLRPLLKTLISPEQKGFLEGRTINDSTRLMCDIINGCHDNQIDGLILLVDFEKAFDSISWAFINDSLKKFNFGKNFITWINMFQIGSTSKITLNGHFSSPFPLQRGCRQGDPISPYLFILCAEFLTLALKENTELEGIKILEKEHKICLYADDTSIFMRASEKNLRICLETLHWFYLRSGLKINIKKTKVIRIGTIRESDRRYCKENNLDWVSSFISLGITYDVLNMSNITKINIDDKIPQIKQLIQNWSNRNITPIGRVTVCKSLIISKITHILMSLPTPSVDTFKVLETLLINFIWKNKRHEVSKETLYRDIEDGGLNMINIREFEKSLKLTWLRKFINGTPDWSEFAYNSKIDRLFQTDSLYHQYLLKTSRNEFWHSVINSYTYFNRKLKDIPTDIAMTPIWGNPLIALPFNQQLFNANIRYLEDLYKSHQRYSLKDFENKTQRKVPFTQYMAIWKCIPNNLLNYMDNRPLNMNLKYPIAIEWINRDKKGTKHIRKIFRMGKLPKLISQVKWEEQMALNEEIEWRKLYTMAARCNADARMKYFNYQILHRTLLTNRKLYMFRLVDSEKCDNCDQVETVAHLLVECPNTTHIWEGIKRWTATNINGNHSLDNKSIALGNPKNSILMNYIIMVTKYEIYKSKWTKKAINTQSILAKLKNNLEMEEYVTTITIGRNTTLGKWSQIYNLLRR